VRKSIVVFVLFCTTSCGGSLPVRDQFVGTWNCTPSPVADPSNTELRIAANGYDGVLVDPGDPSVCSVEFTVQGSTATQSLHLSDPPCPESFPLGSVTLTGDTLVGSWTLVSNGTGATLSTDRFTCSKIAARP
jgi:hypothetical protein